jgi:hypothetical protein
MAWPMLDQVTGWLAEKFGDELKGRLPLPILAGAAALIALFWGAEHGSYDSALLGLLHLTPASVSEEKSSLASLPNYVFVGSVLGSGLVHLLLRLLARRYFVHVCSIPQHREMLDRMVKEHGAVEKRSPLSTAHDLQSAESELELRRASVRTLMSICTWSAIMGAAVLAASVFGNVLDLGVGATLLVSAVVFLHKAVGRFLSTVTPWLAKVEALRASLDQRSLPYQAGPR